MNRIVQRAALFGLLALSAAAAAAQPYPSKPIRLVVPFPAGGTTDILAREVGQRLSLSLGQPVVIDNRPGAAGNIGSELVAKSAPDGYTLLMATVGTHAINPNLYARIPYDHVKDFAPVVLVAGVPNVLEVTPSRPSIRLPIRSTWRRKSRGRSISLRRAAERPFTCRVNSSRRWRVST